MLNEEERRLVEAIETFLNEPAALGLKQHQKAHQDSAAERGLEYLHNHINDLFAHKIVDSTFYDGICAAFSKVHNYKFIEDPTFDEAFVSELRSQGVPEAEISKATAVIEKVLDEVKKEHGEADEDWSEQDFGFHPNADEIFHETQPDRQEGDFEEIDY